LHLKTVLSIAIVLILASCALQNERTLPLIIDKSKTDTKGDKEYVRSKTGFFSQRYKQRLAGKKNLTLNLKGNGYIKGVINEKYYSKVYKKWIYGIKGTDTSNRKLSFAKAFGKKSMGKIGDKIYAIIKNGTIASFYVYGTVKHYHAKKIKKLKKPTKSASNPHKTTQTKKREQIISAPVPEKIFF